MALKYPMTGHPGSGYVYVICDICGGKYHRQDTTLVKDKWNYQYGKVVCKWDLDETNPQAKPITILEKPVSNPESLRSERADTYTTPDTDDIVPSAPRNLMATGGFAEGTVELFWEGAVNCGSSGIIGYKIVRNSPPESSDEVLSSNTYNSVTSYTDTSYVDGVAADYTVYAINTAGVGAVSNIAHFRVTEIGYQAYLLSSQDNSALSSGDGTMLTINNII